MVTTRRSGESSSRTEGVPEAGRADPEEVEMRDVQEEEMRYSPSPPRSPSGLEGEMQAMQRRIEDLEKLKQMKDLEAELRLSLRESSGSRHRRGSHSSSSSDHKEIKLPNIPLFDLEFSIRQRDEWLMDLKQTFQGAKKKYKKDERKILRALASMVPECRARWQRYLLELDECQLQQATETWSIFQDWTRTLLKHAYNEEVEVAKQMAKAHQKDGQSPQDFHAYLDSLEKKFAPKSEHDRSLFFFAKLTKDLQKHVQLRNASLPETRREMVALAARHWESLTAGQPGRNKRKQPDSETADDDKNKTPRQDAADSPRGRGGFTGRGRGRGRGSFRGRGRGGRGGNSSRGGGGQPEVQKDANGEVIGNPLYNDSGKQMTCFTCGSRFHLANHCPDKDKVANVSTTNRKPNDSQSKNT
jgi:uncharacterized membrane protein YgcG